MSVDPLASKYLSYSPYNYVLNNPIILFDPDGRGVERDFNNFVSKNKITVAAEHNSKILTPAVERKFLNEYGPTILDMISDLFLLSGPEGAPFSAGSSALSFYWIANQKNHTTDATVSVSTSLISGLSKKLKTQVILTTIQVLYDVSLSGEDPKGNPANMFAPDNTRVDNSVQESLLGLTGTKSPKEMWDEIHKDSNDNNSSEKNKDDNNE